MKTLKSYQKDVSVINQKEVRLEKKFTDCFTAWMRWNRTSENQLIQPLLKQSHIKSVSQDNVQTVIQHLQGWRLHSLPGQPDRKNLFPCIYTEPVCFSLHPSPLVLSRGTTERGLSPSSLHPPIRYLCTLMSPEPALSVDEESQLSHMTDAPVP